MTSIRTELGKGSQAARALAVKLHILMRSSEGATNCKRSAGLLATRANGVRAMAYCSLRGPVRLTGVAAVLVELGESFLAMQLLIAALVLIKDRKEAFLMISV